MILSCLPCSSSSRKASTQHDLNTPERTVSRSPLPLHDTLYTIHNPTNQEDNIREYLEPELTFQRKEIATIELLNGYISPRSLTDANWSATDRDGSTILQLLAKPKKLKLL